MSYEVLLTELRKLQSDVTLGGGHRYKVKRKWAPGVTTIIKTMDAPALDRWKVRVQVEGTARAAFHNPPPAELWMDPADAEAAEMLYVERLVAIAKEEFEHERIAAAAADVGTQVHALIEHAVRERLGEAVLVPEASDEALFVFAGWKAWAESIDLQPLMAEGRVYHPTLEYCGTFDLLAIVDGRPAILDWKPQETVYPERRLQSAAYREALHATGWPQLDGYIVSLPRNGGQIALVPLDQGGEYAATVEAFRACLSLYQWQRKLKTTNQ